MRRALTAMFVLSTLAALLVPPAAAGIVLLPDCHKVDYAGDCACCRAGAPNEKMCCQQRTGDRPATHHNDCGTCPAGNCCGCCAVGVPALMHSRTPVIADSEMAIPLAVATDRLTTRSDEPLLPPPIT